MRPLRENRSGSRLYGRILFDPELEANAFRLLGAGDLSGCRAVLMRLAQELDAGESPEDLRRIRQLLLDLLQRLNRAVHGRARLLEDYHRNRLDLIDRFCGCDDLAQVRSRFARSLTRLLGFNSRGILRRSRLADRAARLIEARFDGRVSLSSVAQELGRSPNHLSRVFRRDTGMTLTEYVHRIRLDHARRLLTEERYSLSEIADRVGYANYRDFHRNFVKYENAPPRQVRHALLLGARNEDRS